MCSLSLQPNVFYLWPESAEKLKKNIYLCLGFEMTSNQSAPLSPPHSNPLLSLSFPTPSHWILQPLNVWTILVSALCLGSRIRSPQVLGVLLWGWLLCLILPLPYFKGLILVRERKKKKNPPGPETNIFWWTLWVTHFLVFTIQSLCLPPSDFHSIK